MKHRFSPYNRNFSFIRGLKQKNPFIQKIIFININIFKFSSREENSHIIVKLFSSDEKSPYNLPLNWITNYDEITYEMSSRYSEVWNNINKKVMKNFYVGFSGFFYHRAYSKIWKKVVVCYFSKRWRLFMLLWNFLNHSVFFRRDTWKYCSKLSVQTGSWILGQFLSFVMLNIVFENIFCVQNTVYKALLKVSNEHLLLLL